MLDAGCGAGALLYRLREIGWETSGVEIDSGAAEAARGLGLDVRTGTVEEAGFPSGHFDLVTALHVLEHIHRPVEFLNELWRILKPGGLLFIEVPNTRSFNCRVFRGEWFHLDAPRHLCSYSPRSLRCLLRRTGFRMCKLCFSSGTTGLRGSINYSRRARGLKEYGWINSKPVKRMLGMFTFALDIARRGDVIRVEAIKEGSSQ
jgi:SAM-dependent methyltransferase